MPSSPLAAGLVTASQAPGNGLADAALVIARIEYPRLDPSPTLDRLEAMGDAARRLVGQQASGDRHQSVLAQIRALNEYLFGELHFSGNSDRYEDPRNSCLNEVLARRTGIPITLSLVYLEVARRAGIDVEGINFPGHFLVRCADADRGGRGLIIDPFHEGTLLSEHDCRALLERHAGPDVLFSRTLLTPATRQQILVRMLLNLKRIYVQMRSFPQARVVTELLLALTPSALSELRDRGLLAYHLQDFAAALRDLEEYLRLAPKGAELGDLTTNPDEAEDADPDVRPPDDSAQIWEHVKTLRRRVASFN
jgi:regulator of sirC expression with transglutaminase-like and TPR domain